MDIPDKMGKCIFCLENSFSIFINNEINEKYQSITSMTVS